MINNHIYIVAALMAFGFLLVIGLLHWFFRPRLRGIQEKIGSNNVSITDLLEVIETRLQEAIEANRRQISTTGDTLQHELRGMRESISVMRTKLEKFIH